MIKFFLSVFLYTFTSLLSAQKGEFSTAAINDSLKLNANAIVRSEKIDITISSQRNMSIKTVKAITVLNEKGNNAVDAFEHYDKKTSVRSISATVYDASGKEIKSIRRKDFRDQSVIDGVTMFSESRIIYLDYTPIQYPYTIVYESETNTSNTAFIPRWAPLNSYFVSVENSEINISFPMNLGFKKKESSFNNFRIQKTAENSTSLSYKAVNLMAQKPEEMSQSISLLFPKVIFGLENFNLEGIDGTAKSWKEFGKWYSDKILSGTTELPPQTVSHIKNLVGTETDPIKKAKIVYDFVQKKSRYVSIQVGIGGWKPMDASDVDRLGYGDCKALSNYTKALLAAVDVPSYNTVLYGGPKQDIDQDFVSMQGNHMILSIPEGNKYVYLECTSQVDPFGYQGTFTDDRNVLIMKPDGGEIVHTSIYTDKINSQFSIGNYALSDNGQFNGTIAITSKGTQYNSKFRLQSVPPLEKEAHYKNYWSGINNLKIVKSSFSNDRDQVSFTESVEIKAESYASISGNRMMFVVNGFNQIDSNLKRIRNRKTPFEILRGSYDEDEITITLPANQTIESLPKNYELSGKFGAYKTEIQQKDENHLIYKRSLFIKKGLYLNTEYEEFRMFVENIARNDNAKIILIKNL